MFQSFRNDAWKSFEVDYSKYISAPGLSLDLLLKYTDVKIELKKKIFQFLILLIHLYSAEFVFHLKTLRTMIMVIRLLVLGILLVFIPM